MTSAPNVSPPSTITLKIRFQHMNLEVGGVQPFSLYKGVAACLASSDLFVLSSVTGSTALNSYPGFYNFYITRLTAMCAEILPS